MRTSITTGCLAFYLLLITGGIMAAANLVTNGDFETGDFTGWTVTPAATNSLIFVTNLPPAHDTQGAAFAAYGSDFDSISQSLATTPGNFYDLSFFYEVQNLGSPDNEFKVFFNGILVFDNPNAIPGFGTFTFTNLQATSSSTILEFQGRNPPSYDFLDDVTVTARPVPDTGTSILLFSIGLLGLVGLRRALA